MSSDVVDVLLIGQVRPLIQHQKLDQAEALLRQALEGPPLAANPRITSTLAEVLSRQGKPGEAEPLLRRVLQRFEELAGPTQECTFDSAHELATALAEQGKLSEAEPLYRQALQGYKQLHGPNYPTTVQAASNLHKLLLSQQQEPQQHSAATSALTRARLAHPPPTAEPCSALAVGQRVRLTGLSTRAELNGSEGVVGVWQAEAGRYVVRLDGSDKGMKLRKEHLLPLDVSGDERSSEGAQAGLLACGEVVITMPDEDSVLLTDSVGPLIQQKRLKEAEALLRQALPNSEADPVGSRIAFVLAGLVRTKGEHGEAESLYRRALQGFEQLYSPSDERTLEVAVRRAGSEPAGLIAQHLESHQAAAQLHMLWLTWVPIPLVAQPPLSLRPQRSHLRAADSTAQAPSILSQLNATSAHRSFAQPNFRPSHLCAPHPPPNLRSTSAHPAPTCALPTAQPNLRPSHLCAPQPPPTVASHTPTSAHPICAHRKLRPTSAQPPPSPLPPSRCRQHSPASAQLISAHRNHRSS